MLRQSLAEREVADEVSIRQLASCTLENAGDGRVVRREQRRPPKRGVEEAAGGQNALCGGVSRSSLDIDIQIVLERHLYGVVKRELTLGDTDADACRSRG